MIQEKRGSRFVAGKGFYVALAVCLLGAAAAAWISVDRSLESAKDQENVPIEETAESYGFEETNENADLNEPDEPTEVPVDTPQEDIPVEAGDNTVEVGEPVEEAAAAEEEIVQDPSAEAGIFSGKTTWSLPVEGDIINDLSNGELVKNETLNEWRTHNGIDIAAEVGSDIHVCADGTVTRIWSDPLWANAFRSNTRTASSPSTAASRWIPSRLRRAIPSPRRCAGYSRETNLAEIARTAICTSS
jgi:murein DD-endopeptidase MepM/ murein hydrolase activator NlpD